MRGSSLNFPSLQVETIILQMIEFQQVWNGVSGTELKADCWMRKTVTTPAAHVQEGSNRYTSIKKGTHSGAARRL